MRLSDQVYRFSRQSSLLWLKGTRRTSGGMICLLSPSSAEGRIQDKLRRRVAISPAYRKTRQAGLLGTDASGTRPRSMLVPPEAVAGVGHAISPLAQAGR